MRWVSQSVNSHLLGVKVVALLVATAITDPCSLSFFECVAWWMRSWPVEGWSSCWILGVREIITASSALRSEWGAEWKAPAPRILPLILSLSLLMSISMSTSLPKPNVVCFGTRDEHIMFTGKFPQLLLLGCKILVVGVTFLSLSFSRGCFLCSGTNIPSTTPASKYAIGPISPIGQVIKGAEGALSLNRIGTLTLFKLHFRLSFSLSFPTETSGRLVRPKAVVAIFSGSSSSSDRSSSSVMSV